MPVAAAAFLAARLSFDRFLVARLSFDPVFRSALFADFLAFDKDLDFLRFFMHSSLKKLVQLSLFLHHGASLSYSRGPPPKTTRKVRASSSRRYGLLRTGTSNPMP